LKLKGLYSKSYFGLYCSWHSSCFLNAKKRIYMVAVFNGTGAIIDIVRVSIIFIMALFYLAGST
jgi:hypothetical protein